jgi:hypothetical protein
VQEAKFAQQYKREAALLHLFSSFFLKDLVECLTSALLQAQIWM